MKEGKYKVFRDDLLYPELSFAINGALFDVFSQVGGGHKEVYYQKAVAEALTAEGLRFTEQYYVPLKYNGRVVGKYYLDFLVEDLIVLELKKGQFVAHSAINQTKQYLSALNLQLAIIGCFAMDRAYTKRIVNINKPIS